MSSEESTSDDEKANLTIYKLEDNYVVVCLSNKKDQLSETRERGPEYVKEKQ